MKRDETHEYDMNESDLTKYYIPAFENILKTDWNAIGYDELCTLTDYFDHNLGIPNYFRKYMSRPPSYDRSISFEWRERFRKLASPHGEIFYRILKLQAKKRT